MYVKEDKPEYIQCSNQTWKDALPRQLIPMTLPVVVQLIIVEYSTLLDDKHLLINKWHQNWAKWDPTMTDEEKKILTAYNFFLTLTSNDIDHKMDEDTFAHRYLHLLLEEVFNIDDYKFVWHKLGFETFGILIDGSNIKLFSMDLNFNGVYRLNQIRKMTLPTEHANILTIIPVISNFYSLLKRVNHAIEKLNAPSTPMD
ncbi:4123_t:CDS:2 [Entrophospora sp. SA101]|nr:4123_t:CDS:2 [Entrophospora sp. SA101]